MYVSVYSNMTEAPACHVYSIDAGASQDPPSVDTQMMATLLQSTRMSLQFLQPIDSHVWEFIHAHNKYWSMP